MTTDNDRDLLELAAKAAGIEITPHPNSKLSKVLHFLANGKNWNPLTDDGDALRLAVKLGINVPTRWEHELMERHGLDVYEATRKIIVKAAAEIGKTL